MASKTFWKVFNKIKGLAWLWALSFSDNDAQVLLVKELINDKIKYIWSLVKWYVFNKDFTDTTVADQQAYSIPAWLDKINYISSEADWVTYFPQFIWLSQFNNLRSWVDNSSSDTISYYTVDTNKILLYPTPSSTWNTITINWNAIATNLNTSAGSTDENTSIAIKEWWEEVVEYAVLADIFRQREDITQANSYEWKYLATLQWYKTEMRNKTNWVVKKFWYWKNFINPNLVSDLTV